MITKRDMALIETTLETRFRDVFATKDELQAVKFELKNDILNFKDEILGEILAMREELAIVIGYRSRIEDHEERLEKLEEKKLRIVN